MDPRPAGLRQEVRSEARQLAAVSLGAEILDTIGRVYELQGSGMLGGVEGFSSSIQTHQYTLGRLWGFAKAGIRAVKVQQQAERLDRAHKQMQAAREHAAKLQQQAAEAPPTGPERVTQEAVAAAMQGQEAQQPQQERDPEAASSSRAAAGPSGSAPDVSMSEQEYLRERARVEQEAMPHILEAIWAAASVDFERTARRVCRRCGTTCSVKGSG